MGKQATDWNKIFVKDISGKILLCKIYEGLKKLNNKKKIWVKKGQRILVDTSSNTDIQMTLK